MLDELYLFPAPVIIDVHERGQSTITLASHYAQTSTNPKLPHIHPADEFVLVPLLYRLTSSTSLPILLIGGELAPPMPELRYLKDKGELRRMVEKAGAQYNGARQKKPKKLGWSLGICRA